MRRSEWITAVGLASLAAGAYYFNFFIETVDGSGIYLSATYARADLLTATAVLWLVSLAVCLGAVAWLVDRPASTWRTVALAAFTGLMFAVFVRCYLKVAGFGFTDDVLTFDWLPLGGQQRWLLVLPAILATLVLMRSPSRSASLLRFMAICGLVTLPLGAWRMLQSPIGLGKVSAKSEMAHAALAIAPRRVLWLVLDEFDPQVAFDGAMGVTAEMPELSRLRASGVTMTQAAAPAGSTDLSLPAMLLGESARRMEYGGPGQATLVTADGRRIPFDTAHSVFGRLPGGPASGGLLGFYHPYCKALALGACQSFGTNMGTHWYDGLANLVPKRFSGLRDPMTLISAYQSEALPAFAADNRQAMTVLHLNLPHLPSRYAERHIGEAAQSAADAYRINLTYTDRVVSDVLRALERASNSQDQLVILSSDHWWRIRGPRTPYPALLLVKLRWDDEPLVIGHPVSTHHLAEMALAYLRGELGSHADIRRWYLSRPYVPTWIPHAE